MIAKISAGIETNQLLMLQSGAYNKALPLAGDLAAREHAQWLYGTSGWGALLTAPRFQHPLPSQQAQGGTGQIRGRVSKPHACSSITVSSLQHIWLPTVCIPVVSLNILCKFGGSAFAVLLLIAFLLSCATTNLPETQRSISTRQGLTN